MRRYALVLALLTLAGCGQNPRTCTPLLYNVPAMPVPQLVAPAPGSTGVATNGLTVAVDVRTSDDERLKLIGTDGSVIVSGPLAPAANSTQFPNAIGAMVSGLSAHTTYTVSVTGSTLQPPPTSCDVHPVAVGYQTAVVNGTFTTQ